MKRLAINFSRNRRSPRWVSPLLMAVALAFVADVAYSSLKTVREVREAEVALAKLDHRSFRPARNATPEEIAQARETLARLATPWDRLFQALEQAASEKVALLAVQPDPKAGTVVISGDSKDYLAALTYVLNLSRADALDRVSLSRHETKKDGKPGVEFSVQAAWKGSKS
jgi:hypothetical protein